MFKIEVIGNLGADAQIKGENGRQFISFNVAHTDTWTDDAGQKHEQTQWVSCIINDVNSKIRQFLIKGKTVYVRGDARLRVFSSEKERRMVAGVTVNVREIELIGGSTRDIPRQLNDKDGLLFNVYEAYYIDPSIEKKPAELFDRQMNAYQVDNNGFVTKSQQASVEATKEGEDNPYNGENAKTF